MSEVRKAVAELKSDATRKLSDYQKEAVNAEKEIVLAERKLLKSKDALEKSTEARARSNEAADSNSARAKELNEAVFKAEKDIRDDISSLLRVLRNKDQILSASRRAHQKLDKECKKTLALALKKMLHREKESFEARMETLRKFEQAVEGIDVEADSNDFVDKYISTEGCLVLQSQALSILGDLMVDSPDSSNSRHGTPSPSSPGQSASSTPRNSFSGPSSSGAAASTTRNSTSPNPDSRAASTAGAGSGAASRNFAVDNAASPAASLLASRFTNPLPSPPSLSADGATSASSSSSSDPSSKRFSISADLALQHRAVPNSEQSQSTLTEQVGRHLTRLFYSTADDWTDRPDSLNMHSLNVLQWAKDRPHPPDEATMQQMVTESVTWLGEAVRSQVGRDAFITVLNQFRSRKVDVGAGFTSLGTVLWTTLDMCQQQNDVHSASVIMMLSQVAAFAFFAS